MAQRVDITLKTETEHMLFKRYTEEKSEREKLQVLVNDLKSQINELQRQLEQVQKNALPLQSQPKDLRPSESAHYETDEEDLARETEWIRQISRKKRKLNSTLSPQSQQGQAAASDEKPQKNPMPKKTPQPPPIVVENIKNYQEFYDFLETTVEKDSFIVKMMNGECVKINAKNDDSYRSISKLLLQNYFLWHSYENKQDRPIRVMAKNLHSSCLPNRIVEDLKSKGYKIEDAVNKLNWKKKEPLNMFMLSFQKDEEIKKIYNITSILGCKVDIEPIKSSKLIPQCKRCQAYGHTQKYCSKDPRCVKCIGKHLTKDCKKTDKEKPKCVHCGEPHPANYRGCTVAKELQNIRNKSSKKNTPINNQVSSMKKISSAQNVSKNISYAQITKGTEANSLPLAPPKINKKSNMDEKMNAVLQLLTSFDERLKKLEISTKKAIAIEQK